MTTLSTEETPLLPQPEQHKLKWRRRQSTQRGSTVGNVLLFILLSIGAVIMLAPLIWMVSTSLKTKAEVFALPLSGSQRIPSGTHTRVCGRRRRSSQASRTVRS